MRVMFVLKDQEQDETVHQEVIQSFHWSIDSLLMPMLLSKCKFIQNPMMACSIIPRIKGWPDAAVVVGLCFRLVVFVDVVVDEDVDV